MTLELTNYVNLGLRTVIGLSIAGASEFVGKLLSYSALCIYYGVDNKKLKEMPNSLDNTVKNFIDQTSKFLTYSFLGFNVVFLVPQLFKFLNIQRDSFYTEI